ncbi:amino acid permease 8 [Perilla frutescens var. hirtella]|uniref:Amino acid permease 8 n=1 Tax=Perilla frutescens var. hirtella TaxID=608512 RepID=A0AAD4JKZ6_PERFH|nr:amino acid permease 8 [Perilla frutescens var. hirtella]
MQGFGDQIFQVESCESGLEIQKVGNVELDDDGKPKRTGNVWTASAHIITAIIGSGVLSLAWGVAQLGWIAGVATLVIFSGITLYTSSLLTDCYRSPVTGKRNYTYKEVVKNNLGQEMYMACAAVQYVNLTGMVIGYTITASISMAAIQKSDCFHSKGHDVSCSVSHNPYMIGLGILEIFLSQIPNFHKLSLLSVVAAVMSFAYSSIGIGLALARVISGRGGRTTLTGVEIGVGITAAEKIWRVFRAFGDIAFAYTYSQILVEIQDTLKASPPENQVMKKASLVAVSTTTAFYMMCGCFGYAAFGNDAPGNLLTGFGFYEPFWLVDMANACIVLHLIGAYQVFAQPIYSVVELWATRKWPKSVLVTGEYSISICKKQSLMFSVNLLRLIWRSSFVIFATFVALLMPFFNDVLALLGALGYWPLTVYFPIEMYIAKNRIERWTRRWLGLQLINSVCLLVAVAAACGSIQGLNKALKTYEPFKVMD